MQTSTAPVTADAVAGRPPLETAALADRLRAAISGDVRFDRLSRTLYSTDASIYEFVPLGVVLPRDAADVAAVVDVCRENGVSIIARGAGTGLAGGAVGPGVQLDLSRYMNRIGEFDAAARTVVVEPGVVLDELNAFLLPHGLHFAPDVATSSRATIGGMIANNSCGAHSIVYGRTVDHVRELTVILSDGQTVCFAGPLGSVSGNLKNNAAQELQAKLGDIRDRYFDEIERRFPKVMRSNGGYGLDRLGPPGTAADAIKVFCGSEGTLGVIVSARLNLVPLPARRGLAVLHFKSVADALGATPAILRHGPAAVELMDRMIIDAGGHGRLSSAAAKSRNPVAGKPLKFLVGSPEAVLVVEFFGESEVEVHDRLQALVNDADLRSVVMTAGEAGLKGANAPAPILLDPAAQSAVWNLRTAGLGLLMSRPGDAQPYSFVEDSAVNPERLREYIARIAAVLENEGVHAGYYAHASVGCIHVKPVLNLSRAEGVEQMYRIADAVSDLAVEFGGAMTGEHGDGIVRSCWLEKMYGPKIMSALREVKSLFDPHGMMNPHKIAGNSHFNPAAPGAFAPSNPAAPGGLWPMTENLRLGPGYQRLEAKTFLDFSEHGGPGGLAGMCSGVGQCRQRLVGVMCPSYVATGDETHSTRARANALRIALSNRGMLNGLDDPALDEVMDLCISCKACKTECPTGVDMARLKAEYLARRNLTQGASRRARFLADLPPRLVWASRFPRLVNLFARSKVTRQFLEHRIGLDARIIPPRLAARTFRSWFARRSQSNPDIARRRESVGDRRPLRGQVVYFVDTWTNHFTPEVGVAAVELLERAGFEVICPETVCCGRPAISQGLLLEAKELAERNIGYLAPFAARGVPIVGTEPSCVSTFLDEYPRLVKSPIAGLLASRSMMIESLLCRTLDECPEFASSFAPQSQDGRAPILYHGHCHQKAFLGTANTMAMLKATFGDGASELNSGCCGMAGSFGHEKEHYEVARAMGEHRLFPAIRERGRTAGDVETEQGPPAVAVSGFSCRQQIAHHTDARPRHWIELVAERLRSARE